MGDQTVRLGQQFEKQPQIAICRDVFGYVSVVPGAILDSNAAIQAGEKVGVDEGALLRAQHVEPVFEVKPAQRLFRILNTCWLEHLRHPPRMDIETLVHSIDQTPERELRRLQVIDRVRTVVRGRRRALRS